MHMKRIFFPLSSLSPVLLWAVLLSACTARDEGIRPVSESISLTDSAITIQIDYTVLHSGAPQTEARLEVLNREIGNWIGDTEETFRREARQAREEIPGIPPYELYLSDSVFMAGPRMVSIRYTQYAYTGGAHGMTVFRGYNYDLQTQTLLENGALFKPGCTDAVNRLLERFFRNSEECFSEKPVLEAAAAVNFSPDAVTFIYDPYTLGPYACGPAEVAVPLELLNEYLNINL